MIDNRDLLVRKIRKECSILNSFKLEENKTFNLIIEDYWHLRFIFVLNKYNKKQIEEVRKAQERIRFNTRVKKEIWFKTKEGWIRHEI